ncbi:MAG: DUF1553 domain-containing protein [Planctomycetaceae bacterium]|nr:DUF1553 domain-containing protein [Planctomycetaceae bacterium]
MNHFLPAIFRISGAVLIVGGLLFGCDLYAQPAAVSPFFNGKDLTGWQGNREYWSVNDGVIVAKSTQQTLQNELLWSTMEVKNFYLAIDVRLTPYNRNGGIQFRSKPNSDRSGGIGYQADMGHIAGHGNLWGRLYDVGGRGKLDWNTHGVKVVKPGEWNRYEILAVGHRIWTSVNGTLCTAIEDPAGKISGQIGLELNQGLAKTVQYRILEFSRDPKVTLAGFDEAGLIAKLRKPGTNELVNDFAAAQKAASAVRIPKGLSIAVYAAKPQLTNPVALCLDEQGRVYVAEDHRFLEGTPENRTHGFMLEDDLQVTTLEDRLAMQKKWAGKFDKGIDWFTQKSDIVRQLEDNDGDGRADVSRVFADGFDGPLDGLGSGLIARDGKVWYTCIPNLWLLEDEDGDGKAEKKESLLTGFGVNAAFYGHDLHGLVWGVDGKLYFSVGDRGAHVVTKEGTTISNPRRGAVYRCNPDGTELERIHQGLRNPQELAIDQYGNIFADDNNCDKGDHSRLVYVVPGGDSGWNMAYQTIAKPYLTGPWHAEGMWHLKHDLQPAFILPAVGKLGAGPSGFVFTSGTSLPTRYRNHFFYCNYEGNIGGVEAFAVKQQGASFVISDHHDFCKPINASDVDFGYDGKMYIADYPTSPWDRELSGGRIYTIVDKTRQSEPLIAETRFLFQKGFGHRTIEELASLLHHEDMRVRLRAQFALAERGSVSAPILIEMALRDDSQLARLHAIWGLGQIERTAPTSNHLAAVVALLKDQDSEVRAQSARVLGDAHYKPAASAIAKLLADEIPRVRFFAALATGALQSRDAGDLVISMLRENDGKDRYLTHAGVVALERIGDREFVQQRATDDSAAVRMAVLLVQRRWSDPRIVQFLDDAQLEIVTEAARAINDLPLTTGREKLANLAGRFITTSSENVVPLMRRIINANLQLGGPTNAEAVIGIATSTKQPMVVRTEAVSALSVWHGPTKRDRVTGLWEPIAARDPFTIRDVVQNSASKLISTAPKNLLADVTKLLTVLDVKTDDQAFAGWVADTNRSSDIRIAALRLLENRKYGKLEQIIDTLLVSDSAELRAEARDLLASRDQDRATSIFSKLLDDQTSEVTEKQRAIASLARLKSPAAADTLDNWAERLGQGNAPAWLQLELFEAFTAVPNATRKEAMRRFNASADESDPLAAYQVALTGGNAKSGRDIFVGHAKAQCIRCHKIDDSGGTAGPDLSKVARSQQELDRRHYLESIVLPNAKIAKGFGSVMIALDNGKVVTGKILSENEKKLTLVTPNNGTIRIDRDNIEDRAAKISAMPEMSKDLTLREIRDLVEYLSTLGKKDVRINRTRARHDLGNGNIAVETTATPDKINFNRDIRPILSSKCFACHGPDAKHAKGDLRLDLRENATSSDAIVPGKPAASELVRRIRSDDADERMPPDDTHKSLSDDEKDLLASWIANGAKYERHWSFVSPVSPDIPTISNTDVVIRNSIDAFVADRLKREGLSMSPEADRTTLIRRVTLDLTGLPPTIAEVDAFLADKSEQAYERVVDRLLSSPRYAERMAMNWLDVARYADTHGYNNDGEHTQWPWRDWVINAFATNMPYDQFIIDQVAGDLIDNPTPQQRLATAFGRNHVISSEGGIIQEEYRVEYVADRVHTTATAFLGLSMQCARCHDHKFDPITQRDYYSFFAFFNNVPETTLAYGGKVTAAVPSARIASPFHKASLERLDQQITLVKKRRQEHETTVDKLLTLWLREMKAADNDAELLGGLLAHISLDETTGVTAQDSVETSRVGKVIGNANWTDGKLGNALTFDGKTHVNFGQLFNVEHDQAFSMSAWIYPTSKNPITVLSKMDDSAAYRGFDLIIEQGRPAVHLVHHFPDNFIKTITKTPVTLNAWHHVVATYDGSSRAAGVKIYVDGKLAPLDTISDTLSGTIATEQSFHIGRRSASVPFQGKIDEVRIYANRLEDKDVQQLLRGLAGLSKLFASENHTAAERERLRSFYLTNIDKTYLGFNRELATMEDQRLRIDSAIPHTMVMAEMNPPRQAYILNRGEYDKREDSVLPNVPASLRPLPKGAPANRLGLAKWLVEPANPLTARVAVNRFWQLYFGTGIVETVEDFGSQGSWPTHPDLLDWLATEFIASDWNVKAMQKLIVMSATYRQSSDVTPALLDRDPKNRLLTRGARFRLPAEMIRDNALAISGLLAERLGGPSVKPYQPAGLWRDVSVSRSVVYQQGQGENLYRRSMYTFWKRTCPPPALSTFDAPDRENCLVRRALTNTPLQALVLMNDPTYVEAARVLGERVMLEGGESRESKVDYLFRRALARRCQKGEQAALLSLLDDARKFFQAEPEKAKSLLSTGATTHDATLNDVELAAWASVASVVLSLDETINKE